MRELARDRTYTYVKFEEPGDIDRLSIRGVETDPEGFEFFRGLGIVGYARTFKAWLRHFPRPIFLGAVQGRELLAWAFLEEHGDPARDGNPVYVLRAIETLPRLRGKGLGYRLLLLGFAQVTGYVVTKPLTKEARMFFAKGGFSEMPEEGFLSVDSRKFPGYLVMPPHRRREALALLSVYFPSRGDVGVESQGGRTAERPGTAP